MLRLLVGVVLLVGLGQRLPLGLVVEFGPLRGGVLRELDACLPGLLCETLLVFGTPVEEGTLRVDRTLVSLKS